MKDKILNFFKEHTPLLVILGIMLLVFLTNCQQGTTLSGWDNLHPEFNFNLNISRAFFGVWQEYQGLGLLAGMGHASDLFREVILKMFSFVIPLNFLRYFFHFSMLLAGSLGTYFLIGDLTLNANGKRKKIAALSGAIFYLFNLATLQIFYVPYEAFSVHFGFLPWLFWANIRFLKSPSKRTLLLVFFINLLAVAQGYVATFFAVYLVSFSIYCLVFLLQNLKSLKKILTVFVLILLVNSFWLLPNIYYVVKNVSTTLEAKSNLMSTENNLLKNTKYGNLENVTLLKGFWFDNVEMSKDGNMSFQMEPWTKHLQKKTVSGIGYLLFALSIFGLILSIVKKEKKVAPFIPIFLLSFTFLASDMPIFSSLAKLLYKLPLFTQIFRFPFTKFSILTVFCLAVFYGIFVAEILRVGLKVFKGFTYGIVILFISLPMIFMFPVFQGKLFYDKERTIIPQDYFQVFNFFKSQDKNTRIADFPQVDYWGWTNYYWGKYYGGSGFIWYGIEQPILDRNFDMWSSDNENYYWEISYALYSKNLALFETVLEKYQVNFLLVDGNVISFGSSRAIFTDELKEMLHKSQSKIELVQSFGKIEIYKVNLKTPVKNYVWLANNLPVINGYKWGNEDKGYEGFGGYTVGDNNYGVYYPFRSIFTGRVAGAFDFTIEDLGDRFVFKKEIPKEVIGYNLNVPDYKNNELFQINPADLSKVTSFIPTTYITDGRIEVTVPKVSGILSAEIDPTKVPEELLAKDCNQFSSGKVKNSIVEGFGGSEVGALRLEAEDATNCSASFWAPDLLHRYSYLISVETKNVSGKPLLFWMENLTNRKADQELYLQNDKTSYLIQPPMAADGLGYTLHFDNISIGRKVTVNELGKIKVYPIPYDYLMGMKLEASIKNQAVKETSGGIIDNVEHPNPSVYEIGIKREVGENTTLILSQAFHEGWKAYIPNSKLRINNSKLFKLFPFLFGEEIKEHVKVNNWENGWNLNSKLVGEESTLVLVFWPQYLEYIGFFLLIACLLFILIAVK